ncbi:Golgi transport complex subunit 6 [Tieghemiomyces parasiticus]|uniref:Conserved oligomeric Golgi complex subunit 6 n=1 Tax=Tieghemiomyces parasiticus TaxID=78921 RepID=A0A9W8AFC9_9FUNG|nr:Golgi transport complex subunit 6 [Tieghemiomyces parasiticus]
MDTLGDAPRLPADRGGHPLSRKLHTLFDATEEGGTVQDTLEAFVAAHVMTHQSNPAPPLPGRPGVVNSAGTPPFNPPRSPHLDAATYDDGALPAPNHGFEWLIHQPAQLRSRLTRQTLHWNRAYLDSFRLVYDQYGALETQLSHLVTDVGALKAQWRSVHGKTLGLTEQADVLMAQRKEVQLKRRAAESFLDRYTLPTDLEAVVARANRYLAAWEERFQHLAYSAYRHLFALPNSAAHSPVVREVPLSGTVDRQRRASGRSRGGSVAEADDLHHATSPSTAAAFKDWFDRVDALVADPAYFRVFEALHAIHRHTQPLLALHDQRVAGDVMKRSTQAEEIIYNLLYQWVRAECQLRLNVEDPKVTATFRWAVAELRYKPVLFEGIVDTVVAFRREALVDGFHTALVHGTGTSGADGDGLAPTRPLEFHAADPLRYVGDMLAWIHQAHAGEREWLDGVLGSAVTAASPISITDDDGGDGDAHSERSTGPISIPPAAILERIVEGVCEPFALRIRQALRSPNVDLLPSFHVFHLLYFYCHLIARASRPQAPMARTLTQLSAEAKEVFFEHLHAYALHVIRELDLPDRRTLSIAPQVQAMIVTVEKLVSVQDRSFMTAIEADEPGTPTLEVQESGGNDEGGQVRKDAGDQPKSPPPADPGLRFDRELATRLESVVIGPVLVNAADLDDANLPPADRLIYLLNTECQTYTRLSALPLLKDHLGGIRDRIADNVSQLEIIQLKKTLESSGLSRILDKIDVNEPLDDAVLDGFLRTFDVVIREHDLADTLRHALQALAAVVDQTLVDTFVCVGPGTPSAPRQTLLRNWIQDQVMRLFVEQYDKFATALAERSPPVPANIMDLVYSTADLGTLLL